MRIDGSPSLMTSALQTIQTGEQQMLQAAGQITSGSVDDLAGGVVAMESARLTQGIGIKLAKVADDMMKSTLDMLA